MNIQTQIRTSEAGQSAHENQRPCASPLVTTAWESSGNSIPVAIEKLVALASADPEFIAAELPKILTAWADGQIRMHVTRVRLASWTPPPQNLTQNGERLRRAFSNHLMDFPLPGGKRLGDATAQDCLDAASFYKSQADDMAHKGRWLSLVASDPAVKKAARIADAMTEEKLRRLQEKANA